MISYTITFIWLAILSLKLFALPETPGKLGGVDEEFGIGDDIDELILDVLYPERTNDMDFLNKHKITLPEIEIDELSIDNSVDQEHINNQNSDIVKSDIIEEQSQNDQNDQLLAELDARIEAIDAVDFLDREDGVPLEILNDFIAREYPKYVSNPFQVRNSQMAGSLEQESSSEVQVLTNEDIQDTAITGNKKKERASSPIRKRRKVSFPPSEEKISQDSRLDALSTAGINRRRKQVSDYFREQLYKNGIEEQRIPWFRLTRDNFINWPDSIPIKPPAYYNSKELKDLQPELEKISFSQKYVEDLLCQRKVRTSWPAYDLKRKKVRKEVFEFFKHLYNDHFKLDVVRVPWAQLRKDDFEGFPDDVRLRGSKWTTNECIKILNAKDKIKFKKSILFSNLIIDQDI